MFNIEQANHFMQCAIDLSTNAIGTTGENPPVGAIFTKMINGVETITGKGVTSKTGRPHAEINAIDNILKSGYTTEDIKDSTLYVTLEPCSHYGKTKPCAEALIRVGVKKVVIALKDIDTRVAGRGIELLQKANIETHLGILQEKAYAVLSNYFINKLYNRTAVTLKLALGDKNVLGSETIPNVSISNELSKKVAHHLRLQHDAILVGKNTAILDNPILTTRITGIKNNLTRIVLDSNLDINLNSNLVRTAQENKLIIFCLKDINNHKKELLKNHNVKIFEVEDTKNLKDILNLLYKHKIYSVIVEGGAQIAKNFINNDYVDKFALFKSDKKVEVNPIYLPMLDFYKNYAMVEEMKLQNNIFKQWVRIHKCLLV